MTPFLKALTKVIEYDMAPTFMIYFFMIGLGQFYVFAAVFGFFMLITGTLLIIAYMKNLHKLIVILRIVLVIFTVCGFFNLFIDDMVF